MNLFDGESEVRDIREVNDLIKIGLEPGIRSQTIHVGGNIRIGKHAAPMGEDSAVNFINYEFSRHKINQNSREFYQHPFKIGKRWKRNIFGESSYCGPIIRPCSEHARKILRLLLVLLAPIICNRRSALCRASRNADGEAAHKKLSFRLHGRDGLLQSCNHLISHPSRWLFVLCGLEKTEL